MLQVLKRAKPKLRRAILEKSDKALVLAIAECALNVLNGNCKLSKCTIRNLRKYKNSLRQVVDKSQKLDTKRRFIIQKGGFFIPLLSAVLTGLSALINR